MRGRPSIRTLVVLLGLVLAGLPVWRLTHRADLPARMEKALPLTGRPQVGPTEPVAIDLTFTSAPQSFALVYLGVPLLSGSGTGTEFHTRTPLPAAHSGVDLLLKASWPAGTPHPAVRIELSQPGLPSVDRTFWATGGTLTELVTLGPP